MKGSGNLYYQSWSIEDPEVIWSKYWGFWLRSATQYRCMHKYHETMVCAVCLSIFVCAWGKMALEEDIPSKFPWNRLVSILGRIFSLIELWTSGIAWQKIVCDFKACVKFTEAGIVIGTDGDLGVVSLTLRELSKIISRKYTMPKITFMLIISSWNSWEVRFLPYTIFERISRVSRQKGPTRHAICMEDRALLAGYPRYVRETSRLSQRPSSLFLEEDLVSIL